jgi:uncharacterized membrane protein
MGTLGSRVRTPVQVSSARRLLGMTMAVTAVVVVAMVRRDVVVVSSRSHRTFGVHQSMLVSTGLLWLLLAVVLTMMIVVVVLLSGK